jgi:hypothetical protein
MDLISKSYVDAILKLKRRVRLQVLSCCTITVEKNNNTRTDHKNIGLNTITRNFANISQTTIPDFTYW